MCKYFDFWKIRMKAHLEAEREEIWDAIENGFFVPTSVINDVGITKIKSSWNEDDKKNVLYNNKETNLLQATLSMDEFFFGSQCSTTK